ncbi:hypothetical protein [Pontibacter sp. G13]|uniref:hypothetical protein n=1 Tax=Pontibacter sp. G13 TaxID=3074898 RepID=UPI00288A247A|nr:hypothetical protein [Pontibacter sp. G13]WNJ17392.1 hypothetical protein RJD25_21295 [Pontibacter sp. G13]
MHRHLLSLILSGLIMAGLWSCEDETILPEFATAAEFEAFMADSVGMGQCGILDTIAETDLPQPAQDYLNQTFDPGEVTTLLSLQTGDSLFIVIAGYEYVTLFDSTGNVFSHSNTSGLSESQLEQEVLDSLTLMYPDWEIEEVDFEWYYGSTGLFEVEIEDGPEFHVVSYSGGICYFLFGDEFDDDDEEDDDEEDDDDGDDDDDDDEDDDCEGAYGMPTDSLSTATLALIDSLYPNAELDECAEWIVLCDSVDVLEIELETAADEDVELVFDDQETFLFAAEEFEGALPTAVENTLASLYPNSEAEEFERLTWANGDVQYAIEIESENDDDLIVTIADDGTFICESPED